MTSIKITKLHSAGSELFQDSESFLNELTDDETNSVGGGFWGLKLTEFLTTLDLGKRKSFQGVSVVSVRGNSYNKNTIVGRSVNARTAGNFNTVAK